MTLVSFKYAKLWVWSSDGPDRTAFPRLPAGSTRFHSQGRDGKGWDRMGKQGGEEKGEGRERWWESAASLDPSPWRSSTPSTPPPLNHLILPQSPYNPHPGQLAVFVCLDVTSDCCVTTRAGDYELSIKFNDQPIADSPFNVYVSPPSADSTTLDITDLDQQVCQVCLSCYHRNHVVSVRLVENLQIIFNELLPGLKPDLIYRERLLTIDVKTFLMFFYSCHVFNVFFTFFILSTILLLKTFIENSTKKFEKHFWNHRNELVGLYFIVKMAGCRAALYPLRAYSDTAAVTSCSRRSRYVKSWIATNWIN